jgi:hypothetical protein
VQHQNFALIGVGLERRRRRQHAMKADDASKVVLSVARHLQNGQAAEAVANRGHLAQIRVRHFAQLIEAAARPLAQQRSVGRIFHHLDFAGLGGVGADALAIDVDDKGVEAKVAKPARCTWRR